MTEQTTPTIDEVKGKVLPILARHRARRAGLFGSLVRGEMREDSDVDILVEMEKGCSFFDIIALNRELEEVLGRKVDLVPYETIKARIRDRILGEEVRIMDETRPPSGEEGPPTAGSRGSGQPNRGRDFRLYFDDILESIAAIQEYTAGMTEGAFLQSGLVQDAVQRRIGVIGEAIRHVPQDFRDRYPDVGWQGIVDMRNRVIHEYFGVQLDLIWAAITEELGPLQHDMARVLADLERSGGSWPGEQQPGLTPEA